MSKIFTLLITLLLSTTLPAFAQTPEALKKIAVNPESFVEGNLHFIAYHELGHAMISEFKIPVLGREEDAVDRLAIWMMTPTENEEEPEYLKAAISGWFATATYTPLDEIQWWDTHGTDQQRGYQIACLLYGSNPESFAAIAEAVDLPEDRRETCVTETKENDAAWEQAQEPHFRDKAEAPAEGTVKVTYIETKTHAKEQAYLKEIGLLEHIATLIETDYRFEPGIEVIADHCDSPNAFWYPEDRQLVMCYELVTDFQELATGLE